MTVAAPVVLVGGGHAAAAFVNSVRRAGYEGPLMLISDEPVPPYHRPPLSKKYLSDALPVEQILIRAAAWYDEQKVTLRLGTRVARIDREARRVELADGSHAGLRAAGAADRRTPAPPAGRHAAAICRACC